MNAYIIVEGDKTELSVYPAWLSILVPQMQRIEQATQVDKNNYYLFSGHGIPSIFTHVANAIVDINNINTSAKGRYDFLIVCIDTEDETREYIEEKIQEKINEYDVHLEDTKLLVFEQKVCMETWFLSNRKVFKSNPQGKDLLNYIRYYNVKNDNPEEMGLIDEDRFNKKAQFHLQYLKRMLEERSITYNKNCTYEVCKESYLNELISRFEETGHIPTFGAWYEFVKKNFK